MTTTNGLVTMVPAFATGTSSTTSTISGGPDGSISFTSLDTLYLEGVFTASYRNYMIVCSATTSTGQEIRMKLISDGDFISNYSEYSFQYLFGVSSTVSTGRNTYNTTGGFCRFGSAGTNGTVVYIWGPQLNQQTPWRAVSASSTSNAGMDDVACIQYATRSSQGIRLFAGNPGTMSGRITVYAFNQ